MKLKLTFLILFMFIASSAHAVSLRWGQWLGGQGGPTVVWSVIYNSTNDNVIFGGETGPNGNIDLNITMQGQFTGGSEGFVISLLDGGTPCLTWGQWVGGNAEDKVYALSASGSLIYAAGYITSSLQMETVTFQGNNFLTEAFVVAIQDGGSPCLLWGQWIGGNNYDVATSLAVNGGKIYVGGHILVSTLMETLTFQGNYSGISEGFVIAIQEGGTPCLQWGQWIGGNHYDQVLTVIANATNVYAGGYINASTSMETVSFQGSSFGTEGFVVSILDGGSPCLVWGQWVGGDVDDFVQKLTFNGASIFVGGYTNSSTGFETIQFQGGHSGSTEAFIIRMEDGGTPSLKWGQWFGGGAADFILGLANTDDGDIIAGGSSVGVTLETITFAGSIAATETFVIKILDGGTPSLAWGQWFGGTQNGSERIYDVAVNGTIIYAGGFTNSSTGFETTTYQGTVNKAANEGFVIKMFDGGSPCLAWGQWLGGGDTSETAVNSISLSNDNIFLGGFGKTQINFETGVFQGFPSGGNEGFVIKIQDGGSPSFKWGQWLGSSATEQVLGVASDGTNVLAVGYSESGSLTDDTNAVIGGSITATEGFLVNIKDGGSPCITWGQWLGGTGTDHARIVIVNNSDIYVSGFAGASTGFETLSFSGNHQSTREAYIIKILNGGSPSFIWGQWIGGVGVSEIYGMVLDSGNLYVGGYAQNSTAMETVVFQGQHIGNSEGFVIKVQDGGTPCLLWGQWIGGDSTEVVQAVTLYNGFVFAGGYAVQSTGFETVTFQGSNRFNEGFLVKIQDGGTPSLQWGQWVGTDQTHDSLRSLATNGSYIYAGGYTEATNQFETTTKYGDMNSLTHEGYVLKFADGGTPCLLWAHWLGGASTDQVLTIAVSDSKIYAGGYSTMSTAYEVVTFQGDMLSASEAFLISIQDDIEATTTDLFFFDGL